jgi:hypothetical protein
MKIDPETLTLDELYQCVLTEQRQNAKLRGDEIDPEWNIPKMAAKHAVRFVKREHRLGKRVTANRLQKKLRVYLWGPSLA